MPASLEEVFHPGHTHLHPMKMINGWTCNRTLSKLGAFLSRTSDGLVLEWNELHQWLGCVCFPCQQFIRRQALFDFLSRPGDTRGETTKPDMPADPVLLLHKGDELACIGRDSCLFRADPGKDTLLPLPCSGVFMDLGCHRAIFCSTRGT